MNFRQPRIHNEKHLAFVRGLPCVVCKNNIESDAAHIRFADLSRGKRAVGVAEKPDDKWTVPLCRVHHTEQHSWNEKRWWEYVGIDPIYTAELLFKNTGNHEAGCRIIETALVVPPVNIMRAG